MTQQRPNDIIVRFPPFEPGNFYLLTAYGRVYSERDEFITREERAASGKLRRDIVAKKKIITLKYDLIDDVNLSVFDTLINSYADVELKLEVTYNNVVGNLIVKSYDVLIQPYDRERVLCAGGGLWSGVTVEFVEV